MACALEAHVLQAFLTRARELRVRTCTCLFPKKFPACNICLKAPRLQRHFDGVNKLRTDHPVADAGENDDRQEAQRDDVARDFRQEVDGDAVKSVGVLVHEYLSLSDEEL